MISNAELDRDIAELESRARGTELRQVRRPRVWLVGADGGGSLAHALSAANAIEEDDCLEKRR